MQQEPRHDIPENEKEAGRRSQIPAAKNDDGDPVGEEELSDADIIEAKTFSEGSPDLRETQESRREREKTERQPLLDALRTRGLDAQASLEIIAAYDPAMLEDEEFSGELGFIASSYGVKLDGIPAADRNKLAVMYLGAKNSTIDSSKATIAEAMTKGIREQLVGQAFRNIDALKQGLELEGSDPEKIRGELAEIMGTLHSLSKQVQRSEKSNDDKTDDDRAADKTWQDICSRFNELSSTRQSGVLKPEINKAFGEIFDQFGDFIEDEMVTERLRQEKGGNIEKITAELYGRTVEERERIKERNRAAVAEAIKEMADAPLIDVAMIEQLHAINNKGIVPKKFSRMRDNPDQPVTFNKRLGLLAEDIEPEMEKMIERANDLYEKSIVENASKASYEIGAAQLHNDLLDMHPFGDRNGSTSLLFLELLMAKKGFEPPKTREKNYYRNLANIVGYNPAAMAVIGHEQYKIAHEFGHYGEDTMPDDKKKRYKMIMNLIGLRKDKKKK